MEMENFSVLVKEDDQLELPPGFRFHPSDEELITHYLSKKVVNRKFSTVAIGEVDMNKVEPWDMPWRAKMGEKEWYFFCVRDKKYPTGLRTNRATAAGYWKATGKDKEIFRGKLLVGMKKTLVFYMGRAPKGEKSNWVIHEYRLEGQFSVQNLVKASKEEWVICRVFNKSDGGKKIHISGLVRMNSTGNELAPSSLPPLMDSSHLGGRAKPSQTQSELVHVHCFSNPISTQKIQENMLNYLNFNHLLPFSANPSEFVPGISLPNPNFQGKTAPLQGRLDYVGPFPMQNQGVLTGLLENYGQKNQQRLKTEEEVISVSQETGVSNDINTEISSVVSNLEMGRRSFGDQPSASAGPLDFDCIWSY